jgi:hypothetical protein
MILTSALNTYGGHWSLLLGRCSSNNEGAYICLDKEQRKNISVSMTVI